MLGLLPLGVGLGLVAALLELRDPRGIRIHAATAAMMLVAIAIGLRSLLVLLLLLLRPLRRPAARGEGGRAEHGRSG